MANTSGRKNSSINLHSITIDNRIFHNVDPKISKVVLDQLKTMDRDGDGRVDKEEVALGMIDAVQAFSKTEQEVKYMKYAVAGLAGLVFLLAASGLITAYVAAKLAQDMKVAPDGTLVNRHGGNPVKTVIQGISLDTSTGPDMSSRRRELEEMVGEESACLDEAQVEILYNNSVVSPVSVTMNDGTTHGIQTQVWNETDGVGIDITTPAGDHYLIEWDTEGIYCPIVDEVGTDDARKLKGGKKQVWSHRQLLEGVGEQTLGSKAKVTKQSKELKPDSEACDCD